MAAAQSPSPLSSSSAQNTHFDLETQLDEHILAIRNEIAKLRAHKTRLSSALLGSSKVQRYVHARKSNLSNKTTPSASDGVNQSLQARLEQAVQAQRDENDLKIHRLAYGVTAFPFTDLSPESAGEPTLTGVRFDLSKRYPSRAKEEGSTDSYFVMLRRLQNQGRDNETQTATTYLKVHHHTIPAHINLESLADQYLPLPQELEDNEQMDIDGTDGNRSRSRSQSNSFNNDSGIDVTQDINFDGATTSNNSTDTSSRANRATIANNGQNLHAYIFAIRNDLQSWHNRVQSIAYLREAIGFPPQSLASSTSKDNDKESITPDPDEPSDYFSKYSISKIEQTTADAYQIRIVWTNDALGLLKLSYDGTADRAVVYGVKKYSNSSAEEEEGSGEEVFPLTKDMGHERLHDVEKILTLGDTGENVKVQNLVERLRICEDLMNQDL